MREQLTCWQCFHAPDREKLKEPNTDQFQANQNTHVAGKKNGPNWHCCKQPAVAGFFPKPFSWVAWYQTQRSHWLKPSSQKVSKHHAPIHQIAPRCSKHRRRKNDILTQAQRMLFLCSLRSEGQHKRGLPSLRRHHARLEDSTKMAARNTVRRQEVFPLHSSFHANSKTAASTRRNQNRGTATNALSAEPAHDEDQLDGNRHQAHPRDSIDRQLASSHRRRKEPVLQHPAGHELVANMCVQTKMGVGIIGCAGAELQPQQNLRMDLAGGAGTLQSLPGTSCQTKAKKPVLTQQTGAEPSSARISGLATT